MNKNKIFNDPVYGFISIPGELIFDLIEHSYFQRLRRVTQLGLTHYVYPGALHTRFHHALGAMHLMGEALNNLRSKGHDISDEEVEASQAAILLHDVGHGPFSHALENSILSGVPHEEVSLIMMRKLNDEMGGKLQLAIQIFTNEYERPFFHQLVSSQLDIDRLDYLQRDCYFTGVSEGTIGADRIIKMLEVKDDNLVVEEKGIYSIENFLNARRLMYWQVYLHKTAISAEQMLILIFKRAKYLGHQGVGLLGTEALHRFLIKSHNSADLESDPAILADFAQIDDYDVLGSIKMWANHSDNVLSTLSKQLLERKLWRVHLGNDPIEQNTLLALKKGLSDLYNESDENLEYFYNSGTISNAAYIAKGQSINILTKRGEILDVAQASDLPNIKAISKIVKKHYLCWPKSVVLQPL